MKLTFKQAVIRLFNIIIWRFKPYQYLNKKCFFRGKYRKITGETFDYFFLQDFPEIAFPKVGNQFKIKCNPTNQ